MIDTNQLSIAFEVNIEFVDYFITDDPLESIFTARCTLVQSEVMRSHVVYLSVCDIGEL